MPHKPGMSKKANKNSAAGGPSKKELAAAAFELSKARKAAEAAEKEAVKVAKEASAAATKSKGGNAFNAERAKLMRLIARNEAARAAPKNARAIAFERWANAETKAMEQRAKGLHGGSRRAKHGGRRNSRGRYTRKA